MAKRIKRTQIVDATSGEVLQETRQTSYSSDSWMDGKGYLIYSRKRARLGPWDRMLDAHTEGVLSIVVRTMDDNNMVADVDKLAGRFGVTQRRVYQLLANLKDQGAIAKIDGGYVVNPAIAFAGRYLSTTLYKLFEKDLQFLPAWVKVKYEKENDE